MTTPEDLLQERLAAADLAHAAHQLVKLKDERKELDLRIAEAEAHLADLLRHEPNQTATIEGLGSFRRRAGTKRTAWKHEELWERIRNEAKGCPCHYVDQETGEMESDVEHVTRHFRDSAGVGYWKKGGLLPLGVELDEYCTVTYGPASVEVIQ